jgi:hypothetical protein
MASRKGPPSRDEEPGTPLSSTTANDFGESGISLVPLAPEQPLAQKLDAVTDWDGPTDPENPKNWSLGSRIYHTMLPALYGFSV